MTLIVQRQIRQLKACRNQFVQSRPQLKLFKDIFCNPCLNVLKLRDITTLL